MNDALLSTLLVLIPLLPLAGALVNGLLALGSARSLHGPSRGLVAAIAVAGPALAFVCTLVLLPALQEIRYVAVPQADGTIGMQPVNGGGGHDRVAVTLWQWLGGGVNLSLGLVFDHLSALMLLFVTGIGALITLYATGYMAHDRGYARFLSYFNLFLSAMIVLVAGDSLIATFLGWEGVGLCSYLLIGFWHRTEAYNQAAKKAFVMNRIGDLGFLLGAFVLFQVTGHFDYVGITAWFQDGNHHAAIGGTLQGTLLVAALLLFLGCCGKSAQIPLVSWLPDAMAGPTPVSALIHAATMVTAGVFLLARLCDLYAFTPMALDVVLVTGCVTAVYGAVAGLFANDIKKALAYSTVSQLGFMFMAAGAGRFDIALFHVFTHAFFKATLFLGAGSVIHHLHHEQDMRRMGGLKDAMPVTHAAMVWAWLAIIGAPFAAGYWSKHLILDHVVGPADANGHFDGLNVAVGWIGLITAVLTAVYMTRVMALTFWSRSRVDAETHAHRQRVPFSMGFPVVVLGIGSLVAGFLWCSFHWLGGLFGMADPKQFQITWFAEWLHPVLRTAQLRLDNFAYHGVPGLDHATPQASHDSPGAVIALLATVFGLIAAMVVAVMLRRGPATTPAAGAATDPVGFGAHWTFSFDRLGNAVVWLVRIPAYLVYWIIELGVIDGAGRLVRAAAQGGAGLMADVQRRRLRSNLALSLIGAAALLALVLWGLH